MNVTFIRGLSLLCVGLLSGVGSLDNRAVRVQLTYGVFSILKAGVFFQGPLNVHLSLFQKQGRAKAPSGMALFNECVEIITKSLVNGN